MGNEKRQKTRENVKEILDQTPQLITIWR